MKATVRTYLAQLADYHYDRYIDLVKASFSAFSLGLHATTKVFLNRAKEHRDKYRALMTVLEIIW